MVVVRSETAPRSRAWVLLDPKGAFASVVAKPMAVATLAVMLGCALLPPITFLARGDVAAVVAKEMKKSGRMDQVTAEQRDSAMQMASKVMTVALPVGALSKRIGWIFLLTALCFGLMRGQKPELKFGPLLGAVALAAAPLAVHDVLTGARFLVADLMTVDLQNAVLSNPAAWLSMETGRTVAGTLLRGLDLFDLWACVLVGIGASAVAQSRSIVPYVVSFGAHGLGTLIALAGVAMRP